jgi:ABC-2 type transport system ATP-binding protein
MHVDKSLKERAVNAMKLRRTRDDFWALRDVSFDVPSGSTIGLIGHNGSGKSTLLKVIGGIIQPTSGTVSRRGRLAALLELGAGFHPDLTGRDNVYLNAAILGLSKQETDRHFDAIVEFSGIEEFIDTQVKFYSSGMYVRLAFAVAIHVNPDVLLVDEVLAVGDEPFQRKCMNKIAEFQSEGRTIVLVSHSADQVGSMCDTTVVLEHGHVLHVGDTETGLRILRKSFQDDDERQNELSDEEHSRPVSLASCTVVSATGEPIEVLAPGEDVHVKLDYEITRRMEPWKVGIAIETALGQVIYRTTTTELGVAIPVEPGKYQLAISFKRPNLGSGHHAISVGLADEAGTTHQVVNPAASFSVSESGVGRGLIRLDTHASLQRLT